MATTERLADAGPTPTRYSKPAVATDERGNRDLVLHGVNGFLAPLEDAGVLAREIGERGRGMVRPYALENVLKEMGRPIKSVGKPRNFGRT